MIVWFMCKCGSTFLKLDQYIKHKKKNHFEEYRKSKCVVFVEKIIEDNIDDDSDSDSGHTNNESNSISTPPLPSTSLKTKIKSQKLESKPTVTVSPPLFLPTKRKPEPESEFAFQQQPQADTEIEAETDPLEITTKSSIVTTKITNSHSRASVDLSDPDDGISLACQEIKTEPVENSDEDFESFEACSSPMDTSTEADVKTELTTFGTDEDQGDSDSSSSSVFHVPTPQVQLRRLSPRKAQQTSSYKLRVEKKSKPGPIKKPVQPVLCDICGLTFRIKSDLLEHKSVHRGPSRIIQWVEKGSFSSQEEANKAINDKWKIQYTFNGATSKRVTYYCRPHGIHCPVKVQLAYPVEQNNSGGSDPGSSKEQKILFLESPSTEHKIPEGKEKALSEPIKERMRRLMEQGITGALRILKILNIQHNPPTLMQVRNFISRYKHLYDPKSIEKFKLGKIKAPPGSAKLKPPSQLNTEDFSNEATSTQ